MSVAEETGVVTGHTRAAGKAHWIEDWDPEDTAFWDREGSKIAKRNLIFSIFSEHIGFSIWTMWSTLVLFLGPKYGLTPAQKFTLTSVPAACGSFLRLPYTFAVAKFGGRNWTIISAVLLLIPSILTAILLKPGISYGTLLFLGAIAGVGGGNFASSMANINVFYPSRLKGWALGLNAAGGNLGVATIQIVGLIVLSSAGVEHPRMVVGIYIPFIVLATLGAALYMDNIANATNEKRAMRDVTRDPHTWVMSFLYIGTFGSFIGFGFAFGQVLLVQFPEHFSHMVMVNGVPTRAPDPVGAAHFTFLGPLIGSLARPIGGFLADRFGGAFITFWNFVLMTSAAIVVLVASKQHSLGLFLIGFCLLFTFAGVGNGSTYKMIPAIFKAKALITTDGGGDHSTAEKKSRRHAGALIGIAGAIGAFGGVLVNIAFRQSFLHNKNGNAAYISFIIFYGLCFALTWLVYMRKSEKKLIGV